jgi:response regulator RpfG family c-di-GMP phosphodiesterase
VFEETAVGEKVLFVDDEAPVLDGYQRLLRQEFTVQTALGGEQGLAIMRTTGPYAVVVSDMRMPGMNGAEFLAHVREKAPNTIRILLTGHADFDVAIEAVNRGNIYKFLTKPCKKEVLTEAINSGLAQYRAAEADVEIIKKAQLIGRSKVEWDSADLCQWDNFEGPAGLPGPSQARSELEARFGTDAQCFVVLIKLTLLQTVETRYGEKAAADYLKKAVEFLSTSLKTNDRIFHWSRDVLMMIIRRHISPAAVRMEVTRLAGTSPQQLVEANQRQIMMATSMTFDLLPIAQFPSFNDMIAAFNAKLVSQL